MKIKRKHFFVFVGIISVVSIAFLFFYSPFFVERKLRICLPRKGIFWPVDVGVSYWATIIGVSFTVVTLLLSFIVSKMKKKNEEEYEQKLSELKSYRNLVYSVLEQINPIVFSKKIVFDEQNPNPVELALYIEQQMLDAIAAEDLLDSNVKRIYGEKIDSFIEHLWKFMEEENEFLVSVRNSLLLPNAQNSYHSFKEGFRNLHGDKFKKLLNEFNDVFADRIEELQKDYL